MVSVEAASRTGQSAPGSVFFLKSHVYILTCIYTILVFTFCIPLLGECVFSLSEVQSCAPLSWVPHVGLRFFPSASLQCLGSSTWSGTLICIVVSNLKPECQLYTQPCSAHLVLDKQLFACCLFCLALVMTPFLILCLEYSSTEMVHAKTFSAPNSPIQWRSREHLSLVAFLNIPCSLELSMCLFLQPPPLWVYGALLPFSSRYPSATCFLQFSRYPSATSATCSGSFPVSRFYMSLSPRLVSHYQFFLVMLSIDLLSFMMARDCSTVSSHDLPGRHTYTRAAA